MAVTYQTDADTLAAFGVTSASLNLTVLSGGRRIVVAHWHGDGSPGTFTTVTFGGTTMTVLHSISSGASYTRTWYLVAPATGSQTLSLVWTNSVNGAAVAVAQWNDVDQVSPIQDSGTYAALLAATTTATISLTTDADSGIGSGFMSYADLSDQSSQTLIWNRNWSTTRRSKGAYDTSDNGSTNVSWRNGTGVGQSTTISAYSLKFKGGGGTQAIIIASRIHDFLGELKRGLIPPDELRRRYGDLVTI